MSELRLYVKVPFEEKDEAKALGARWDPRKKKWWFPPEKTDAGILAKWAPLNDGPKKGENPRVIRKSEDTPGADRTRAVTDKTIRAWFDGGSRGNPGICGHGAIVRNGDGTVLSVGSGGYHRGTNNEAEHRGCMMALRMTQEILKKRIATDDTGPGCLRVEIRGDSKMVINQALGKWKCEAEHLKEFVHEEHALIHSIRELARDGFLMEHVLREDNKDADALANLGMDQVPS